MGKGAVSESEPSLSHFSLRFRSLSRSKRNIFIPFFPPLSLPVPLQKEYLYPMFPYENLDVYKKAYSVNQVIYRLLKGNKSIPGYARDQLGRPA